LRRKGVKPRSAKEKRRIIRAFNRQGQGSLRRDTVAVSPTAGYVYHSLIGDFTRRVSLFVMRATTTFANFLVARRLPLLALALVAGAVSWPLATRLEFDRNIENMFAADDPVRPPFLKLKRTFGSAESVLAVYDDPEVLAPAGVKRVQAVAGELARVDGVKTVIGLHSFMGDAVLSAVPSVRERMLDIFTGFTHDAAGTTAALVCLLEPRPDHRQTVAGLREVIGQQPSGVLAGEPVMVTDGFEYIQEDGVRLGYASTVLLGLVIIVCFRSVRWVVVPVAVVQLALLLTRAILVQSRLQLSMVSSMLTAIVTVVAVGTVIHIVVHFREDRRRGMTPEAALANSIALLAMPVLWSIVTDVIGFSSLMAAHVGPVQDFGLMMAIGSAMVLVAAIFVVPGLALTGKFDIDPHRAWGEGTLDVGLSKLVHWIDYRPKTVAIAASVLAVLATAGLTRVRVETDFTKNFRASSPIVRSYELIEARLGGAGVWDVVIPAPRTLDRAYLARVRRMEAALRALEVSDGENSSPKRALTGVLSLADVIDATLFDRMDSLSGPFGRSVIAATIAGIERKLPGLVGTLFNVDPEHPERHYFRIMLRAPERQSAAEKEALIGKVEQVARAEFPEADATGYFVLLARLIQSMLRDQWVTFGVATAGIFLTMVAAFRSVRLALVALVPNLIPVFGVSGLWGWLGLKINMGAAMIAAVSMGLAIDSSVHYITAFRRARHQGAGVREALDSAHQGVGRAMVFSTLALVVGFLSLCQSNFVPTIYFGILVSLTMLGGLAGNLIVLPLLLRWIARK
jgi:predicted RND superfamily exporter protein